MASHPVETYLTNLSEIHRTGGGTAEESYYGALETLLNEIGAGLKPKVRCVAQLQNTGGGEPDFGLYTADQFQRGKDLQPMQGQKPARGVIECKGWDADAFATMGKEQVAKYWKQYGVVLVTNYRDFVLVGSDATGHMARLESYRMAESENAFRGMLAHPHKAAQEQGERLTEFLRRALLHNAPLAEPEDLAWFLASYAREARARVEEAKDLPALAGLKKALEDALGMKFEGEKGEHFFRATLVQTLFYGVFSSWVLWARENPEREARFDWRDASWTLHVPMIKSLFEQIATASKLKGLHIDEVLNWAGMALGRVDRGAFFAKFEQEQAVQYFYEPFLKAYDPELRKELGVWYTPPEIVQYQVERVDRVLREELGIADGLADEQVVILDPCCGTGAYLVETLKRIHKTLEESGGSALTAQKLKKAATGRVFGFEILPAPFVVAHLQLGLMLRLLGAPLSDENGERAGVYLTNALTGWEPPKKPKDELPLLFPELMEERDAANKVKQQAPILVILGNPPYNGYAGTAIEEERDLVTAYRTTKRAPAPQGQGLNDLYIRFFRMAERRIVEKSGRGVICYISNYSWLEGLSHTGMRETYLDAFDKIWIDCLNGDKYKTGKLTPDGDPDPSAFSTEFNREGIQVGTAIALLLRQEKKENEIARCHSVAFRHLWGKGKLAELLRDTHGETQTIYKSVKPSIEIGYPFMPAKIDTGYMTWPSLSDLFPVSFPGVKTSRDEFLVAINREKLEERITAYFNPAITHEEIGRRWPTVMEGRSQYSAREVRDCLLRRGHESGQIMRYCYRPFDVRWLYWEPNTSLLDRNRSEYFPYVYDGNYCLVSQQKPRREWSKPQYIQFIGCLDLMDRSATCIPWKKAKTTQPDDMFSEPHDDEVINLSDTARQYTQEVDVDSDLLFFHVLAIMHSDEYAKTNEAALRQDWPRVPLPMSREALQASAALGRRVAALLDTEKPVEGVTRGKVREELKTIGVIRKVGGGALNPAAGELDLTAGWGHGGQGSVVMPGKGKVVQSQMSNVQSPMSDKLGAGLDIYLNDVAYWANVPEAVWEYHIGGYQVIKKWLSYREKAVLGRGLTLEEAEYVTEMARRLAALVLMREELDANYAAVKAETWEWGKGD